MARYLATASLINDLAEKQPHRLGCTAGQRHDLLTRYTAVLNRADWSHTVRAEFDPANDYHVWITGKVATRLGLTPFE